MTVGQARKAAGSGARAETRKSAEGNVLFVRCASNVASEVLASEFDELDEIALPKGLSGVGIAGL